MKGFLFTRPLRWLLYFIEIYFRNVTKIIFQQVHPPDLINYNLYAMQWTYSFK